MRLPAPPATGNRAAHGTRWKLTIRSNDNDLAQPCARHIAISTPARASTDTRRFTSCADLIRHYSRNSWQSRNFSESGKVSAGMLGDG